MGHGDNLGDVGRLDADALHVRDHLEGGGNRPQIPGHRLLLKQQLQTEPLHVPFLVGDLGCQLRQLGRQLHAACQQGLGRQGDGIFAQCAHDGELMIQLLQLFVESASHISQTSR